MNTRGDRCRFRARCFPRRRGTRESRHSRTRPTVEERCLVLPVRVAHPKLAERVDLGALFEVRCVLHEARFRTVRVACEDGYFVRLELVDDERTVGRDDNLGCLRELTQHTHDVSNPRWVETVLRFFDEEHRGWLEIRKGGER